jgi:hypothetical protein
LKNRGQIQLLDGEYRLSWGLQRAIMDATLQVIYPKHTYFTGALENEQTAHACIGQIQIEDESSRLIFIYPGEKNIVQELCDLIEGLGVRAGAMGAHYLLAAVEESNPLHFALCQCCYHALFTQKYWRIDPFDRSSQSSAIRWQPSSSQDLIAIQSLIRACVPTLVQPIWRLKPQRFPDLVYRTSSGLDGMASIHRYGDSSFIYPLIHPNCSKPTETLAALISQGHSIENYLLIPSFQNFLEKAQTQLKAVAILKQTMMVKYFVIHQKAAVEVEDSLLAREKIHKPTTPLAPTITREKY